MEHCEPVWCLASGPSSRCCFLIAIRCPSAHLLVCSLLISLFAFPPFIHIPHPCFNKTPCLHYIIHITHCLVAFKSPRLDSNFFRGQAKNLLRQIGGGEITTRKCEIYPVWIFRNNMMSLILNH